MPELVQQQTSDFAGSAIGLTAVVGVSWQPHPAIVVGARGQSMPETYDEFDDGVDAEIELELAPRVSAGIDVRVTQSLSILAGALFKRSAVPDPSVAGAQTEDYYGGSAGVQWQSGLGSRATTVRPSCLPLRSPPPAAAAASDR